MLNSKVLRNFFVCGLNVGKFFAFVFPHLLEKDLIDLLCQNDDVELLVVLKGFEVRRPDGLIEAWIDNEVDFFLPFFHLAHVIVNR